MDLEELLRQILISTPFIAAGAWLLREIFKLFLSKDLESFKSKLEKETLSHKIRFEKLHGERMEVIKNVFQKIDETYYLLEQMVGLRSIDHDKGEREYKAFLCAQDLKRYIEANEIFFTDGEFSDLKNIYKDANENIWSNYQDANSIKESEPNKANEELIKVWEHIQKEAPQIKSKLAGVFREAVGININA